MLNQHFRNVELRNVDSTLKRQKRSMSIQVMLQFNIQKHLFNMYLLSYKLLKKDLWINFYIKNKTKQNIFKIHFIYFYFETLGKHFQESIRIWLKNLIMPFILSYMIFLLTRNIILLSTTIWRWRVLFSSDWL